MLSTSHKFSRVHTRHVVCVLVVTVATPRTGCGMTMPVGVVEEGEDE